MTVSFHLGEMSSTIDVAREAITAEELERVEDTVNEIIGENRPVSIRTVSREEAEMLFAAGSLLKLPDRAGEMRLIEIEEIDLNACGGTHVQATGQIAGLLLRGTERTREGTRLEFVCGLRAAVVARHDLATLTRAAGALSVARLEVADAVERLLSENKAASKTRQKLMEDLAQFHADSLLAARPATGGVLRVVLTDRDAGYIKLLASRLTASAAKLCVLLATTAEEPARVVIAAGAEVKVDCGSLLRQALAVYGLRGGGSPGLAQGQIPAAHLQGLFDGLESFLNPVVGC